MTDDHRIAYRLVMILLSHHGLPTPASWPPESHVQNFREAAWDASG